MLRPLFATFILGLVCSTVSAGESFPYQALVQGNEATVLSGPGKNYPATETLPQGFVVEVYRHDPGGWCAIRPTPESFSWVTMKGIKIGDDGVGQAVRGNLTVYVGSALNDQREVHQVRLKEGEAVEVMGTSGEWCKIAPPSGEFRWIHSRELQKLNADEIAAAKNARETVRESGTASIKSSAGDVDEDADLDLDDGKRHTIGLSKPGHHVRAKTFDEKLADIDLQLSQAVVNRPSDSQLGNLKRQAEELMDTTDSNLERGKVRLIIGQIDRFQALQQRQLNLVEQQHVAQRRNERIGSAQLARASSDSRYDGTGRLQRVVTQGANGPQYALIDLNGNVKAYVNAPPGVNLSSYQNLNIGVNGSRNYLATLQKPLIDVQRVTVLTDSQPMRR